LEGISLIGKSFSVGFEERRVKSELHGHGEALAYFEGHKRFVVTLLSTVHLTELNLTEPNNQEYRNFIVIHRVISIKHESIEHES